MYLRKYSDIFGKPEEGAHKPSLFGFAIVDVLLTIIVAIALAGGSPAMTAVWFVVLLAASVGLHWLFGVDTRLMRKLGLANVDTHNRAFGNDS